MLKYAGDLNIYELAVVLDIPVPPENSVCVAAQGLVRFAFSGLAGNDSASRHLNGEAAMGVVRVIVFLLAPLRDRAALAAATASFRISLSGSGCLRR